jgi:hypothetical protein
VRTKSSSEFITDRAWFREIVGGQNMILRCNSALLFHQLPKGYFDESEISVYSTAKGEYENIDYRVVSTFDGIDYFEDGGVLCTTLNQTVNDLFANFEDIDHQASFEALNRYYFANGKSFDGISVAPQYANLFEEVRRGAVLYSNEG